MRGLRERPAVGLAQQLELVAAEPRARLLFGETHGGGLFAGAELVPGAAVGAHDHPGAEIRVMAPAEEFERAGRHELEVVEVGMDAEHAHGRLSSRWAG